jgi:hypothetical protein
MHSDITAVPLISRQFSYLPRVAVPGICLRASAASNAMGFFSNKLASRIRRAGKDFEPLFGDSHEQGNSNLFQSSLVLTLFTFIIRLPYKKDESKIP